MKRILNLTIMMFVLTTSYAQFHTLAIPHASPHVTETQKLGITDITIDYRSPALKGRDVWNNRNIVPQKGKPFPWRAGANMSTTISFTTDVTVEGQLLKAGTYGIHMIPDNNNFTIMFAHNHHQWGSYYLDTDKDVSIKINVTAVTCPESEQLDYEFLNRTSNSLVIALEWGKKRIPFKVEVDLNKTVIESLRSELRGINTYHWQAWNDAANWCLRRNTNLEEALEWVNRSINGGYRGFAGNKNWRNLTTKKRILEKLNRTKELQEVEKELQKLNN